VNMLGGLGHALLGKLFCFDSLKFLGVCKCLFIPSMFPEFCITLLQKKLDGLFIIQVIFVEYNY